MRKIGIVCLAVFWGAGAWADLPPVRPEAPGVASLRTSKKTEVETRSVANEKSDDPSRSHTTAPLIPSDRSPIDASDDGEQTNGSIEKGSKGPQPPETPDPGIVLDFRTRELMELKRIARELGGNLVISIEPHGISPEDLIVPLKNSGLFEVSAKDGKIFLVTSNGEGQKRELEREIAALARRQAALLRNIEVLEAMKAEGKLSDAKEGERNRPESSIAEQESPPVAPPNASDPRYPLPVR